ncbi:MAG: cytidine deaminase [Bacteroidaceae bacterium]|nr:cytidine deaminase [Bacteroidaceae bacterium]
MKEYDIRITWKVYCSGELDEKDRSLVEAAKKATCGSHSPYSGFKVGAAVLLDDGSIITGSNQENAAYPSGLCAERTALYTAGHNHPNRSVVALAIAARNEHGWTAHPITPCGACRQVMAEYESISKIPIKTILYGKNGTMVIEGGTSSLLPFCFGAESME